MDALEYARTHADRFLEELRDLVRIPSVSSQPARKAETRRAAEYVASGLRAAGLENVGLVETPGYPVVVGDWLHAPGAPTLLCYAHYDVQPEDPIGEWTVEPFGATVRGDDLVARGACDDKGPAWAMVKSAEAWLRGTGSLPVNLRFAMEGEEEVGSTNFRGFLEQNRSRLTCDLAVVCDTSYATPTVPAITYGLRGMVYVTVHLRTLSSDVHSGIYGGAVTNPLSALAALTATLHHPDGSVAIEGFYDGIPPIDDGERASLAAATLDEGEWKKAVGAQVLRGEPGYSLMELTCARPTCEINGMWGGYQGDGSKTVIPAQAHAKISCRLVPGQDPSTIQDLLVKHLRAHVWPGVTLEVEPEHMAAPVLLPRDHPAMKAASKALQDATGHAPELIRSGGTIGAVGDMAEVLGATALMMPGGGPGEHAHGPDEFLRLRQYTQVTEALIRLWQELSTVPLGESR